MKQKHIVMVHGGETFDTNEAYLDSLRNYRIEGLDFYFRTGWKDTVQNLLGDDHVVIRPEMPNKRNAQYVAWKIWFEKIFPFLNDGVILVGTSLGGAFLAKYLAENVFPHSVEKLFLIAAPFNMADIGYSNGDFIPPADYSQLVKQCKQIYIYHSHDDTVVPFSEAKRYQKMFPDAHMRIFSDKGHFGGIPELPEFIEDVRK